jgi:preprotein translocase subunit SecD
MSRDDASTLAIQLNAGALPVPIGRWSVDESGKPIVDESGKPIFEASEPMFEDTVSATLGEEFVGRSALALLIGLGLVMLFMILYYRLPGVLASLALIIYGIVVLAIFKLIPVTLTLAGIGGFVLSIGMAVDANVLIFERMKEELRVGRTLRAAIETGFDRAWVAIRDSNVSTLIICGILYWFGSSIVESPPVVGFATTLAIGIAMSMITAIAVTRTFLRFFTGARVARRRAWFGAEQKTV